MKRSTKKPVILSLVGARPQFVKLAPIVRTFQAPEFSGFATHRIVHSGQHYDPAMSDVFFQQLKIPTADVNLSVGSGSHGQMTAQIIDKFEQYIIAHPPALIMVYGDTNTTLAGALVASKLGIPLAHIESGLRSFDLLMPEEINRRVTDHISNLLFAPSGEALKNLKRENVHGAIHHTGDVMYELLASADQLLIANKDILVKHKVAENEYALVTAHRPATVDSRESLGAFLDLLETLDMPIIFPAHPRTLASIKRNKFTSRLNSLKHVRVSAPLSYLDVLTLTKYSAVTMTDSGGLQKEAVFQGVKCLTMRETTEWVETLAQGNHLIGLSVTKLKKALKSPAKPGRRVWKVKGQPPSQIIIELALSHISA